MKMKQKTFKIILELVKLLATAALGYLSGDGTISDIMSSVM